MKYWRKRLHSHTSCRVVELQLNGSVQNHTHISVFRKIPFANLRFWYGNWWTSCCRHRSYCRRIWSRSSWCYWRYSRSCCRCFFRGCSFRRCCRSRSNRDSGCGILTFSVWKRRLSKWFNSRVFIGWLWWRRRCLGRNCVWYNNDNVVLNKWKKPETIQAIRSTATREILVSTLSITWIHQMKIWVCILWWQHYSKNMIHSHCEHSFWIKYSRKCQKKSSIVEQCRLVIHSHNAWFKNIFFSWTNGKNNAYLLPEC